MKALIQYLHQHQWFQNFSVLYGDADLHRRALHLAGRLSLPAAYDAHYLALAERLGAELWTADRRLVEAVQAKLPWVHLVEGNAMPGRGK